MAITQAEIYLLRHGETEWNVEGRYQGNKDSPLTEKGKAQAQKVGSLLVRRFGKTCPLPFHVSPLARTRATAEIIQKEIIFPSVTFIEDLREISFGVWEGMLFTEVVRQRPELADVLERRRAMLYAPKGEDRDAIMQRVTSWLESLTGPVVALSHGVLGRVIRGLYMGLSVEEMLLLPIPQDSIWHLVDGQAELLTEG